MRGSARARPRPRRALNMDETGWRTAGQRRALWGAFTGRHGVLQIASDRGEEHAKALLGDTTRDRDLGSLVGLRPPAAAPPPGLLGAPAARLPGPGRGSRHREGVRRRGAARSARSSSGPGRSSSTPATAASSSAASARCAASSSRCCGTYSGKAPRYRARAGSRATCSRAGRRCGRSPTTSASSRPTTTPNAPCAPRSSTASCRSAASPTTASGASNGCSQPTPPAAYSAEACTLPDRPSTRPQPWPPRATARLTAPGH